MKKLIALLLVLLLTLSLCACGSSGTANVRAVKLSEGYESNITEYNDYGSDFTLAQNKLAVQVFAEINKQNADKNILVSPISLTNILGMLLSGANGDTAAELSTLLSATAEKTNHNLHTFFDSLPTTSKIANTNSVWIKDDNKLSVKKSFLQNNADFYAADIFKMPFDDNAKTTINDWVKNATNGEIDSIVNKIDRETCLYLINALTFDAEWHTPYAKSDISSGTFNTFTGAVQVEMMRGKENYYINTHNSTGFIKEYKNGDYRFVALLPNEGTDINKFISELQSNSISNIIKDATERPVISVMPKFETTFEMTLIDTLKNLGVTTAFDADDADFTGIGAYQGANLYLADIMQKTYITVDEKGTKAGAVTKAEIAAKTSLEDRPVTVTLDRPFVYAIIEANTNIPLFIGKVVEP